MRNPKLPLSSELRVRLDGQLYQRASVFNRNQLSILIASNLGRTPKSVSGQINNWARGKSPLPEYLVVEIEAILGEDLGRFLGLELADRELVEGQDKSSNANDSTQRGNQPIGYPSERARSGAGFGDPAENALVEKAAIKAVTKLYEDDGWNVVSCERERCGFDLECRTHRSIENVEVKGVSGTEQAFIITAGEVQRAQTDPNFILIVATSALTASPEIARYSGSQFTRHFKLSAIQYRAELQD